MYNKLMRDGKLLCIQTADTAHSFIPGNSEQYKKYLEWEALGNVATEVDVSLNAAPSLTEALCFILRAAVISEADIPQRDQLLSQLEGA